MTSLSQTAFFSKKIVFALSVLIAGLLAFLFFTTIGKGILAIFIPPKPFPATVAFGKLPPLNFSNGFKPPDSVVYTLQTVSGDLPKFEKLANVFEILPQTNSFGDLAHSKIKARNMGFSENPMEIAGTVAKFPDIQDGNRVLTMDMGSGNFEINSNFFTNVDVLGTKPKSADEAKRIVGEFVKNLDLGRSKFPDEKITTALYKIDGTKLTQVDSIAQANLVAVIYGRSDAEKFKVVYENYKSPELWFLVSGQKIVAAKNSVMGVELEKFATYPLRTVETAYADLKKGNAVYNRGVFEKVGSFDLSVASSLQLRPFEEHKFPIFSVELGYLLTSAYEPYLQPVYVFNSENGLAAYVTAIDDAWVDHSVQ